MGKNILNICFFIIVSVVLAVFSCGNMDINTTSTTEDNSTKTTINNNLKGTFQNDDVKIIIDDSMVIVIDSSNKATTYYVVSSDGNKIVVKDQSGLTIDIVIVDGLIIIGNKAYDNLVKGGASTISTTTTTAQNGSTTTTTSYTTSTTNTTINLTSSTSTTSSSTTTSTIPDTSDSIIYVSNSDGLDTNDGGIDTPVKTISKAVSMINSSKYNVYVAMGTYNELVNITSSIPMAIKGGYNNNWERDNSNDKSLINGINPTTDNIGRITTRFGSKVTLENLNIKGTIYNNAYGIVNNGDLTIDNCDIVAIEESGNINYAYGIYNKDSSSKLSILSGTITGATDDTAIISSIYGVYGGSIAIISGTIIGAVGNASVYDAIGVESGYSNSSITIISGTIIGAVGNVSANNAYGVYSWVGITMISGTIIGATNSASVHSNAYGFYSINSFKTTITGGTITGAANSASVGSACGIYNTTSYNSTISNCEIYGREPTVNVSGTINALDIADSNYRFVKGSDGPAIIQDTKGVPPNLWDGNDPYYWTNP